MRRCLPSVLPTLRVALALALAVGLGAAAAPAQDDREEDLERIRGEISRLQVTLGRLQQQERSLAGDLERTTTQLAIQEQRVAEAQAAGRLAAERVAGLEGLVADLEEGLVRVRADLSGRLTALYRLGRGGYLRLLLSLDSRRGVLPAVRQLRFLARRDGDALDRFVDTRARLQVESEELAQEQRRALAWLAEERARAAVLESLRREQRQLLARVERERSALATRNEELSEKERKLSNFIAFLFGRTQAPLAGTPIQSFRGVLDWPVRGRVTVPFGPRLDPRYRTRVPHHGIELATAPGADVRVVFPGEVLYASPFRGYGLTAIVHHPGRVFTLYAGLADLRVGVGDAMSLGEVVGPADESLYFEIREENRPQDPLGWLRD